MDWCSFPALNEKTIRAGFADSETNPSMLHFHCTDGSTLEITGIRDSLEVEFSDNTVKDFEDLRVDECYFRVDDHEQFIFVGLAQCKELSDTVYAAFRPNGDHNLIFLKEHLLKTLRRVPNR